MLELRALIQQELDGNPTLEMEDTDPKIEDKQREAEEFDAEFEKLSKLDEEWRDYMAQNSSYARRNADDEERRQFFFDSLTQEQTLQQHLHEQLRNTDLSKEDMQLGELIIGNIDDVGFLCFVFHKRGEHEGTLEQLLGHLSKSTTTPFEAHHASHGLAMKTMEFVFGDGWEEQCP